MKKKRPNRNPASKYINVVDDLCKVQVISGVTKVTIANLIGIEYVTLHKMMNKERNVCNHEIAQRMCVVVKLLNDLVEKNKFPLPAEISHRQKSAVEMAVIDEYLTSEMTNEQDTRETRAVQQDVSQTP